MPALSVCLIVKNEEQHLPRCLESLRGLADEIVVVDTGSADDSAAIARAHGGRVFEFTWGDDFSAARNFSIEQATGDWILALDADETIAARDHAVIRAMLDREDVDAVIVPQRHYLPAQTITLGWQPGDGGYEEGTPYAGFLDNACRRLFRNLPWLRFQNRVHEELRSLDAARPIAEAHGTWVIHHFGKLGTRELLEAKGETYLRIGRTKVEEQPNNPQAHYELGIQYVELNDQAAALACHTRALELSPGFRDAWLRTASCHFKLGHYHEALAALEICADTLPQHAAEIASAEGNVYRELGDDSAAERAFRRALQHNAVFPPANINLALIYKRQGRLADALTCLDQALQGSPRHTDARLLRAEIRLECGDEPGALTDLDSLAGDDRAYRLRARILVRQRRFADAAESLDAVIANDDAETAALRGAIALGRGELDEAVRALRNSLGLHPTYEAALNLSTALHAQRNHADALAASAEALRLNPTSPQALDRFAHLAVSSLGRREPTNDPSRLTIFFYQPNSITFDGTTPRTRGLGGTESAIVYLAEALVQRGHRCAIFNNCEREQTNEGVEYARWETLPARAIADRPDVVVGVRFWQTLGRTRFAPLQVFWTGDAFDQPFVQTMSDAQRRREIDLFVFQSQWQAATFHEHHGVPWSRIVRTPYGVASSAVGNNAGIPSGARARRLAYASTPFRGLDVLLGLFPQIRAACPDAELDVFSSMKVYGVSDEDDQAQFAEVYRLAQQPGVTLVGSVPQLELARRLQQTRILAYPNHYAETFCIAAAEAEAAGCVVVTTDLGALAETVGDGGICIPGDPRTSDYQKKFVDTCVALLTDDDQWRAISSRAMARASTQYSYASVADRWERMCRAALTAEPPQLDRIAVHLASGRASLAQKMLARTERPQEIPGHTWEALQAFARWRGGDGPAPPSESIQAMGLHFPSLRHAGVLDEALRHCSPLT